MHQFHTKQSYKYAASKFQNPYQISIAFDEWVGKLYNQSTKYYDLCEDFCSKHFVETMGIHEILLK